MSAFTRRDVLRPGFGDTYRFIRDDEEIASFTWIFIDGYVECDLRWLAFDGQQLPYPYWVKVAYTETPFGGMRAWFLCPHCEKRVHKLFLSPGGEIAFWCRECHDLTYKSRQREWPYWGERMEKLMATPAPSEEEEAEAAKALLEAMRRPIPDVASLAESGGLYYRRRPGRPREKRPYRRTRPFAQGERTSPSQRLCMRCRDYREIENPQPVTLPNGRSALAGHCPVCGAKMTVITKGD